MGFLFSLWPYIRIAHFFFQFWEIVSGGVFSHILLLINQLMPELHLTISRGHELQLKKGFCRKTPKLGHFPHRSVADHYLTPKTD